MKKADKQYFDKFPNTEMVLKVGKDYFLPSEALAAKIKSNLLGMEIEIITKKIETNVEKNND